jgi:hypothetical protein
VVDSFLSLSLDSSDCCLVGLLAVMVAVAVTVATDCAVAPPTPLFANNNAPMSSAGKIVAARARDPKRFLSAGF